MTLQVIAHSAMFFAVGFLMTLLSLRVSAFSRRIELLECSRQEDWDAARRSYHDLRKEFEQARARLDGTQDELSEILVAQGSEVAKLRSAFGGQLDRMDQTVHALESTLTLMNTFYGKTPGKKAEKTPGKQAGK